VVALISEGIAVLKLSVYRFKIDDELTKTEINFFTVTFTKLMQRMRQVEGFYKELLDQSFDFSIKDEINLDYKKSTLH